ncbi:hypothetical protein BHE74_00044677 [Ensete ventricosum]|nr:hypothetical protein BHE74_00044677 [Ensete ventricosum]RZS20876.1 hypothetical protein BHM03_00053438 [Ensete ventricosum]
MVQRLMVEQFKVIQHTWEKSRNRLDHVEAYSGATRSSNLVNNMMTRTMDSRSVMVPQRQVFRVCIKFCIE